VKYIISFPKDTVLECDQFGDYTITYHMLMKIECDVMFRDLGKATH